MNEVENKKWANASRVITKLRFDDTGAATAEYAIATVAAAGFAGLLAVVLKSSSVQGMLTGLITGALGVVS